MENLELYPRACSCCGKGMDAGFVVGEGERYACSDKCLFTDGYTPAEYEEDFNDDYAFWTQWNDEDHHGEMYTLDGRAVEVKEL